MPPGNPVLGKLRSLRKILSTDATPDVSSLPPSSDATPNSKSRVLRSIASITNRGFHSSNSSSSPTSTPSPTTVQPPLPLSSPNSNDPDHSLSSPSSHTHPFDVGAATSAGWQLFPDRSGSGTPLRGRKTNQDCFGIHAPFPSSGLYVGVFDGHGSHGKAASQLVRDIIPTIMHTCLSPTTTRRVVTPHTHNMRNVPEDDQNQNDCTQTSANVASGTHPRPLVGPERRRAFVRAFGKAFCDAERQMRDPKHEIDHAYSGTTATCFWVDGSDIFCAWVGDSRCVLARRNSMDVHSDEKDVGDGDTETSSVGEKENKNGHKHADKNEIGNDEGESNGSGDGGATESSTVEGEASDNKLKNEGKKKSNISAVNLSWDQKPGRRDEKRRVRAAGGRVTRWQSAGGPQRVWLPEEWMPGLAMTRSVGDTILSKYGVVASPEVTVTRMGAGEEFVVLASDGVWEFMSSDEAVQIVAAEKADGASAEKAARTLVDEAVRRWESREQVVDDTTAVVVFLDSYEEHKQSVLGQEAEESRGLFDRLRWGKGECQREVKAGEPWLVTCNGRLEPFLGVDDGDGSDREEGVLERLL